MRVDEIENYDTLEKYIRYELSQQTLERRIVDIVLPEKWFFKLAKYICF